MGKRIIPEGHDNSQHISPVSAAQRKTRKRKNNSSIRKNKNLRLNNSHNNIFWHENDDEDSSSSDGIPLGLAIATPRNASSKQANNSSILLNSTLNLSLTQNDNNSSITESPKPVYTLRPSVVNGTILYDLTQRPWRLGRPIGKGNFGEIFLASDNVSIPVTNENAKFVVKIEPHSNGPLFVEIHCLMNTAKKYCPLKDEKTTDGAKNETLTASPINVTKVEPSGIPDYIASGSHYFGNARYRFLVLPRFDRDLHSLIKKCRVHQKSVLTLAVHIINVLENLHDRGYCHNDVKAQNLMISKCKYLVQQQKNAKITSSGTFSKRSEVLQPHIKTSKYDDHYDEKQQTTDSGNSSEREANDEDDENFVVKQKMYSKDIDRDYDQDDSSPDDDEDEDEDFDDGATTNSMNSNSLDHYSTPINRNTRVSGKRTTSRNVVQYSGSNPVRSCRREKRNSIYDEMVKSHYLRPAKRISYSEFFNEDGVSIESCRYGQKNNSSSDMHSNSSDDESEDFVPLSLRRIFKSSTKKMYTTNLDSRRLTRRQEKLLNLNSNQNNIKTNTKTAKGENVSNVCHNVQEWVEVTEERIFLIDYGLASKYIDKGVHRPFVMDQRRAHDGTLEFTSRDAHMGAHSRRSDMECLGYNLLFWSLGYLPWKEAATNQQQEKVHRAKEFLMTDVRELLIQIYGKQVPKYLGEYLHLVGQLSYHERPDYNSYRRIFEKEYQKLGYSVADLRLNMTEIQQTCVRVKEEIENKNDFFETNKNNGACNMVMNIMQNLSVACTPFQERTLSNRVSPKNLRSKSDKKGAKKKKFSWAEILSQDPDQIARERAEKEFDREDELSDVQQQIVRRYQGKPTKTIVELLTRLGRSVNEYENETAKLENEFKRKQQTKDEDKIELDEYDNVKSGSNNCDINDMEAYNDDDDYQAPSAEDCETDITEASEKGKRRKIKSSLTAKCKSSKRRKSNNNSRKNVARKLVLKTPNTMPLAAGGAKDASLTVTPICARTRRKLAASTIIDLITPSPGLPKTRLTKSTARKRGSATKLKVTIQEASFNNVSLNTPAASATGETKQHQQTSDMKRKHRPRRRLIKTDLATHESLQDDSNSNFSPNVWKLNTEGIYSRNCKK